MVSAILTTSPKPGSGFKFGVEVKDQAAPKPTSTQATVNIQAGSLNHRDIWILKGELFDNIPGSILGSDAVGVVASNVPSFKQGQRVLINPGSGWDKDPRAPEGTFRILGLLPCIGTLTDTVAVETDELVACPEHLSTAEAAALPLAGLTAYRALFTKAKVSAGEHVLVTGIGGGVALFALQFAVAAGAHVYVTSSDPKKIEQAIALGAKGGINYRDDKCIENLEKLLNGNLLSAVIDGAGGPLYSEYPKVMRPGGIFAHYGQTAGGPGVIYTMAHILQHIDVCGSTMGSRAEFKSMVDFVDKRKIKPVVSRVWKTLNDETINEAIDVMRSGKQFGKLVIEIGAP